MELKAPKFITASFTEAFRPFYFICKVFGLANFTWNEVSGNFETKFYDYLLLSFSVIYRILIVISVAYFMSTYNSGFNSSFINGNYVILFYFENCFISILILLQHFTRKHIIRFIKNIQMFDEKLSSFKWKFQVIHSSFYYSLFIFFHITIVVLYIAFDVIPQVNSESFVSEMMYIFRMVTSSFSCTCSIFYVVVNCQFILSSYCILTRLKALNKNTQ